MQQNLHILTFSLLATITTIIIFPSFSYSNNDDSNYLTCSSQFFTCGKFQNLTFPFWGNSRPRYCGHGGLHLRCEDDEMTIEILSIKYYVLELNKASRIMKISRADFRGNVCPHNLNAELDSSLFGYTSADTNETLFYNCSQSVPYLNEFTCTTENDGQLVGYLNSTNVDELGIKLESVCKLRVDVPILEGMIGDLIHNRTLSVNEVLNKGFQVKYWIIDGDDKECRDCVQSAGVCGYNSINVLSCFHQATPAPSNVVDNAAEPGTSLSRGLKLGLGFGAAGFCLVLMLIIFFICQRRNGKKHVSTSYVSQNTSSDYSSMADLEKMGNAFGVNIFTYSELVEATNNFDTNKELGDGGFGTVYYGKLKDGRVVAVKRLYENNFKRVEQFLNEVEILTRLRHQNLVLLYGCTSRHSQELLLVYEYIPNGTVADHLHGERIKPGCPIPWATRLKIAIETASALAYLHASDVIHRDVKTNNILLDNNFCVKVADFGLSRLFPTDVTHVSTAPQGTPGYVDPDYHQCYQLTDKSDVYSFGVVMIELISSKPAVDITRHRHEINLSNMAINKIQNGEVHELVDISLGYELDRNIHKMMNAVAELAFQCLQSDKDLRPSMKEVLKTLIEIQSDAQNAVKPKDVHVLADDDVVPIKNGNLAFSPDSVTVKWTSSYTTLSSSG